ncbi:IS200/IS605 family accessory protein TnpB-related protein [Aetokthonos hydrillicola Thurmond2011]|uniref:IS200/IS605 family accessory protein TnpB-related protein n=1 Tax=Aetokthonos hydrillicola Thurmond2011 TaxID=2712845 RepID=A0AAP5M899_9CYAN|nr:IS200/IS605 family accessory protein TnpB-related protein [Aetokthonos hydrillicola]MBO3463387.1 IS200/IS605 family element transposase accessory protein TnpB [Aetokthonos hydrillicola CCALA 1050]MBW4589672.1 IS200/IS605 family accessory protein TnpB-related protein [Aetokthonos hydrillicola CCALA 1050]MDR9898926.1 IS200/IS605 family accessory protein TnpB-related protein [Aetokthonos hydrillicola Thurmond2011]
MSIVTIQTVVKSSPENEIGLDYLEEYGKVFGQATRTAFSIRNRIGKTDKKAFELEKLICKELETRYGLSNTEAKNAYNKASAVYDSQLELVDLYIEENIDRIKGIRKTIKKLEFKLNKANKSGQQTVVKNLKRKIHFKTQKINKLEAKIKRLRESKAAGTLSVVLGTSKLFEKQYRLEQNGYKSHEEWLEDWRDARSNRSFFIGSKNFASGNQLVRYDAQTKTLTITVSPCLREKYGDSATLHNISFPRGQEWLLEASQIVRHVSTRNGKNGEKKQASRNGSKLPVTYEMVNRTGKVYINATIETLDPQIKSSLGNGALGIDFNPSSIDWTLIDRHGNLKRHGSIKINVQDKRSVQTKDIIGKAVAQLVRIAAEHTVPIVIEDLDFAKKKASMKEKGAKYARMLSGMAYSQFLQMMESRCLKSGVELINISAAYTSVIGLTKYMAMYGLSSGCAAALVIARRGQGRIERLPNGLDSYFKKPEDKLKSGAWSKVAKKINICGGFNRHKYYSLGIKQVRTNCSLHGTPRQTKISRRFDTVQVLLTPHIHQKPRAIGSPILKGVNP